MSTQDTDSLAHLGEPLARGRTSVLYAWKKGMILKLFHSWFPLESIEHEARMHRAVHSTGLSVPRVGEIVKIGGRIGLEFERLEGVTLSQMMRAKPWAVAQCSQLLADLQASIHTREAPAEIPSLTDRLRTAIESASGLGDDLRRKALAALSLMPNGGALLHGDLHPGNVVITQRGPVAIDWIDAARGSPPADVARTSVLVRGNASLAGITNALERLGLYWAHRSYWRRYFQLRPDDEAQCKRWIPLVAAARLAEGIDELVPWLRAQAKRNGG